MTALPKESAERMLLPHALKIAQEGGVVVKMKATVVDSERLSFTVLRNQMQTALDSLDVVDSRGNVPLITFISPTHFDLQKIRSQQVWETLLLEARGARVQIETKGECVDGTLMGVEREFAARAEELGSTSVVLLSNGEISVHRVDDIRSLCFLDDDITERLKRESFLRKCVVDTSQHYQIIIVVFGEGEGVVNVSYRQHSPYTPAFETFYIVNGTADLDGCKRVKRFFTIRNPMHYDFREVEVQLEISTRGRNPYPPAYGEHNSQSSSSDNITEHLEDNDDEYFSGGGLSTTSFHAGFGVGTRTFNIDQKLSLNEGDSVRIFHSETIAKCDVLVSNWVGRHADLFDTRVVQNVGCEYLGAGTWFFDEGLVDENSMVSHYAVEGRMESVVELIMTKVPRCRGVKQRVPEIRQAVRSEVIGNKLRVGYGWCVTTVYRFENESNLEFEMLLRHKCAMSGRRASHIAVTVQCVDKGASVDETSAKLNIEYCGFRTGYRCYLLKLVPCKETIVTVKEESTPECLLEREYSIPRDCTVGKLQFLWSRGAVNEGTMKLLEEARCLARDFAKLKQDRRAHVEKQDLLLESLEVIIEDDADVEEVLGKYVECVQNARTMKEAITETLESVEYDMAQTKLEMKKLLSTLSAIGKCM